MSVEARIDLIKMFQALKSRLGEEGYMKWGYVEFTGDGNTTTFEARIKHGLVSDKVVVSASSTRTVSSPPSYLYGYLADDDNDGFYETLVIVVRFDTAPANGEKVKVFYKIEVIE